MLFLCFHALILPPPQILQAGAVDKWVQFDDIIDGAILKSIMANLTTEYLDKALKAQDKRFDAKLDQRFQEQDKRFDAKFNHLESNVDARFKKQEESLKAFVKEQDVKLEENLKTFIKDQDEELARIVNKAFDQVARDANARDIRLEKVEKITMRVATALNL